MENILNYLAIVLCLAIAGAFLVKRAEQPPSSQQYFLIAALALVSFAGAKVVEVLLDAHFWERWWLLIWTVASVAVAIWAFMRHRRSAV